MKYNKIFLRQGDHYAFLNHTVMATQKKIIISFNISYFRDHFVYFLNEYILTQ